MLRSACKEFQTVVSADADFAYQILLITDKMRRIESIAVSTFTIYVIFIEPRAHVSPAKIVSCINVGK